ncbi:hypothetical protein [Dactylosporangium sp. NPDC051541]|uniref:hypothetical protein n=1 Tax=Dactylosporangium sp. NPDC051541 TaxID=3363977 RepID=UPI0037AF0532
MSSAHDDPQAPPGPHRPATPEATAPPPAQASAAPETAAAARPQLAGEHGGQHLTGEDAGPRPASEDARPQPAGESAGPQPAGESAGPQPVSGPPGSEVPPVWAAEAPYVPAGSSAPTAVAAPPQRSSRLKLGIVAAVSAVIVIGGGVAVAQAASDSNSSQSSGPGGGPGSPGGRGGGQAGQGGQGGPGAQNGQNQNGQNAQGGQGFPGGGPGGPGGFGPGFGGRGGANALVGALHGDFVVKGGDGQYVTERLQSGTVTAVSATSITAKSEDGHATTFVVSDATKVDNGVAKIADVKAGDTVTIVGTVAGDTATATEITDTALMRQGNNGNGGNGQQRQASPRPTRTA